MENLKSSMDRARTEFHVSGLLEILAINHEERIEGQEREEIDNDARDIIARFIPEKERKRFYEMYEDDKNRLKLDGIIETCAGSYNQADDKERRKEITQKVKEAVARYIPIKREKIEFYRKYKEFKHKSALK